MNVIPIYKDMRDEYLAMIASMDFLVIKLDNGLQLYSIPYDEYTYLPYGTGLQIADNYIDEFNDSY